MSLHKQEQQPVTFSDIKKSLREDFSLLGLKSFLLTLKRGWGMIFRLLFIGSIPFISYILIDPPSIMNVPLSQLTIYHLLMNVFAFGLAATCVVWFFAFPKQYDDMQDNPYDTWANFGFLFIAIGYLIWEWSIR